MAESEDGTSMLTERYIGNEWGRRIDYFVAQRNDPGAIMKGIQRKRTKGWRMPERAISVTRPGRWGNPYTVHNVGPVWFVRRNGEDVPDTRRFAEAGALRIALDLFRSYAEQRLALEPTWLDPLRGHDLACWCGLGAQCHRDVLIDLCKSYFGESSSK